MVHGIPRDQIIVIHIIRTKKIPFFQSTASPLLILSTILCLFAGWVIPYTPLGALFGFTPLPLHIIFMITCIVAAYLLTVEVAKRVFYGRVGF